MNVLTLDLETTGLNWQKDSILLIGYCIDKGEVKQILVGKDDDTEFRNALKNPNIIKRAHNGKFDLLFLAGNGFEVNGVLDDTALLAYLRNPFEPTGLKYHVENTLKKKVVRMEDIAIKVKKKHKQAFLNSPNYFCVDGKFYPKKKFMEYNIDDVVNCDLLREFVNDSKWYKEVEQPLVNFLIDIEKRGIQLNINYLKQLNHDFKKQLEDLEMYLGDINAKSPKQVKEKLNKEGLSCLKTDKLVLKQFAWGGNEYCKILLRYREASKLQTTYITPLLNNADKEGRIHGSFNQSGTDKSSGGTKTGRLTSSDPNLQNIPSRTNLGQQIRKSFIPTKGYVMFDSDLRQIEPRLIAHFSQAPKLINAFKNGLDTHGLFASDIYDKNVQNLTKLERFIGKTSWLATLYGCYYKKLLIIAQINSDDPIPYDEEYFKTVQDKFWKANPELLSWRNQEIAQAKQSGYITTIGGRKIVIPNLYSKVFFEKSEAERQVINYKIQGSAADIMKLILVNFKNKFVDKDLGHVLATIHDEVLGEFKDCSEDKQNELYYIIDEIMTDSIQLNNVKIEADTKFISNWGEK